MTDRKPSGGLNATPSLSQGETFKKAAGESQHPPEMTVNGTARAELDAKDDHERAVSQHDMRWKAELQKLSASSMPTPEFDLGSRGQRNLLNEYEERRTTWEMQRDQIDAKHDQSKAQVREDRPTLSAEFEHRNGPGKAPSPAPKPPEPARPAPTAQAPNAPGLGSTSAVSSELSTPSSPAPPSELPRPEPQAEFSRSAAPSGDIPVHAPSSSLGHSR